MKNYLITSLLLFAVLNINVSAHKSIWPSCNYLSNTDKSICVQFHYLKGSNRIAEFRKIAEAIFKTNDIVSEKKYKISKINLYDIMQILGEPDAKINNKIVYNLNTGGANCKAIIEENIVTNELTCVAFGMQ